MSSSSSSKKNKQKSKTRAKFRKAIAVLSQLSSEPNVHRHTDDDKTLSHLEKLHVSQENVKKYQNDHKFTQAQDAAASLTAWLASEGVTNPSVEIRASSIKGAGNGVFVVEEKTVSKLTTVISVPTSIMISSLLAIKDSTLRPLFAASNILKQQPSLQLALILLRESYKGEKSAFYPYISTFPETFSLPLWWSMEELNKLRGTSALRAVARNITSFSRFYTHIYGLLKTQYTDSTKSSASPASSLPFPIDFFTFNNFKWSMSVVMTRQNPVPYKNNKGQVAGRCLALVPVMDMVNHGTNLDHGVFYDDETETVNVACMCDTNHGEELRMYYGDRSNQEFLVHSGFVCDGNINDSVTILVQASSCNDPLFKVRSMVLKNEGIVGVQCSNDIDEDETKNDGSVEVVNVSTPCGNDQTCPVCSSVSDDNNNNNGVRVNYEFEIKERDYVGKSTMEKDSTKFSTFCQIMLLSKNGIRAMLTKTEDPKELGSTLASLPLDGCLTSLSNPTRETKLQLAKQKYITCALLRRRRHTRVQNKESESGSSSSSPTLAEVRRKQEILLLENVLSSLSTIDKV
jgi:hypothetical protein